MPNKIWFFPIDRAAVKAPFEERQELTPDEGCDAAEWAIKNKAFIELYVQDDELTASTGETPLVGWTVGVDESDLVGYGLGHDRTSELENEVTERLEVQKLGYERAWFKSLLERSLTV